MADDDSTLASLEADLEARDLARVIASLVKRVTYLETRQQLGSSSLAGEGDDDTEAPTLSEVVDAAMGAGVDSDALNAILDENLDAVRQNAEDVVVAAEAASEAGEAGAAAADIANEAADDALAAADIANENATNAINAIPAITAAAAAADAKAVAAQAAALAAQASAVNVIPDASFENDSRTMPTSRYTIDTTAPHTGAKSLRIGNGATAVAGPTLVGPVPVAPGQTWRARVWTRASADYNGTPSNGKLRIGNQSGTLVASITYPASTSWVVSEVVFTITGTATTSISMTAPADNTLGSVNLDDVELTNITDAKAAIDAAAAANDAATVAQTSADGKTTNYYSPNPPTPTTPGKAGDAWFVRQSNTGIVTGWFEYTTAGNWMQRTLDNATIANLDAGKINAGFIAAARIAAGTITGDHIAANTIQAANIMADTLTAREIAADAITAAELAANAVIARNIKAAEIQTGHIAALAIDASKIQAGAIIAEKIGAGEVTATKIATGAITATKIAADAIDGKIITGTTLRTAASGGRVEVVQNKNVSGDPYQRGAVQFIDSSGNIAKLSPGAFGTGGVLTLAVGSADANGDFSGTTTVAFGTNPNIPDVYPGSGANLPSPPSTMWIETSAANITAGAVGRLSSVRTGRLLVYDGLWITPTVANANQDSTTPVRYRLFNGFVVFDGLLGLTSASLNATIFNLPAGYRPGVAREVWVNRGSATEWIVRIQAGGNVALLGPSGGAGSLQFASIPPFIAEN